MANPDYDFMDGFDKYGEPVGLNPGTTVSSALLTLGDWTSIYQDSGASDINLTIVAALVGSGYALGIGQTFGSSGKGVGLQKVLPANYARSIGGYHINQLVAQNKVGFSLRDGTTQQVTWILNTTGHLEVYRGNPDTGTLLATSTEVFTVGVTYCLEWDITIHPSAGIVKFWINSVASSISLTGANTRNTANSYFNSMGPYIFANYNTGAGPFGVMDHLYCWLYTASGGSETPALTNPVVETSAPSGDDSIAFTKGPGVLGVSQLINSVASPGANRLSIRRVIPEVNCTLNSVSFMSSAAIAAGKFKAVLYTDSAGAPTTVIATGTEVIGSTADVWTTLPFAVGQTLTGGTAYWIGLINDTAGNLRLTDLSSLARGMANTYTSGAPASAATSTGTNSYMFIGNYTGSAASWPQENETWAIGDRSYNWSATVNQEDLYTFPALSGTPSTIYSIAVKAAVARSDAGARTVDLRMKSSGTTASGSLAGQTPSAGTYGWLSSYFRTDPNTGASWILAAANAAKAGLKIAS